MKRSEDSRDPLMWLRYAQDDQAVGEIFQRDKRVAPRFACFHAQQAAEKAIKSILVFLDVDFPRKHDLEALRRMVPDDWQIKNHPVPLTELTEVAVEARYPHDWEVLTTDDAERLLAQSRIVLDLTVEDFARRGVLVNPGQST